MSKMTKLFRKRLLVFLKKIFKTVETADNGEEGLNKFKAKRHDLIIADVKMPKLNGIEMSRLIKKSKKDVVVIITSAYDDKKLLLNAIKIDVDHYILKPFDNTLFIAVLYKMVSAIKLKKDIEYLHKHQQEVLDFQDNLVFTLKGKMISSANRRFLDFFDRPTVKKLNEDRMELAGFVIKEEGFYYPGNLDEPFAEMHDMIGHDFRIKLLDTKNNENRIFYVRTGYLDSYDEVIVSMTDISNIHDQEKSVEMSEKDRCFFDLDRVDDFYPALIKEIDRSKHHSIALSLLVIEITGEEVFKNHQRLLEKSIKDKIAIVDFFARTVGNTYVLVLVHTDIFNAVKFAKMVNNVFLGESDGTVHLNFGITEMKKIDDEKILIERAEHLKEKIKTHEETFINTDHAVDFDAKAEEQHDWKTMFHSLGWVKSNNQQIKSFTIYRGLQVTNQAYIIDVSKGGSVMVSTNAHQLATLNEGDTMFLTSENFHYPIKGAVRRILSDEKAVTLVNLAYIKDKSIADRKNIRVEIDEVIPAAIRYNNEVLQGRIVDMSIRAVGVEVPLIKELGLGKKVDLLCSLTIDNRMEEVRLGGEVYKIMQVGKKYHIVIIYHLSQKLEAVIHKFISKYQLKIVQEMNKKWA